MAALNLAWWAVLILDALGWFWLAVLAGGWLRLRAVIRQLERDRAEGGVRPEEGGQGGDASVDGQAGDHEAPP